VYSIIELDIRLLKSIEFSINSPPVHLKHVSLQKLGYYESENTIDAILSCCSALETLRIDGGAYFESITLQNIASPVLREISIVKCKDLRELYVEKNLSLRHLKLLDLRFNFHLTSISLDSKTSPLPSLQTIDVSHCSLLIPSTLASFCNQAASLRKLIATDLPGPALKAALARFPALQSLKIEGASLKNAKAH
jgi:hypothetical protein